MIEYVNETNVGEFDAFLQKHPGGSYLQSSVWAKINPEWRWRAFMCRNEHRRIVGVLSVMIREIPLLPYQMMYCCRGPVCSDVETAKELLDELRDLAAEEGVCLVRLDPPFEEKDAGAKALLEGYRYKTVRHDRKHAGAMQPRRSWVVPIRGTWDTLQQYFTNEHIQSLQMAIRSGVVIRRGSRSLAGVYAELEQQGAFREGKKKIAYPQEFYETLIDNHGARIYMAYVDSRPVAGAVMVGYGKRTVCLSMTDISNPGSRAAHLLVASILSGSADDGYQECEFPGLPAEKTAPLYELYSGFGGYGKTLIGEMEWCRKAISGRLFHTIERADNWVRGERNFIGTR